MADNSSDHVESECVSLLKEFGFTQYEAATFVQLLRLGSGTAKDVAEVSEVPRTRVYDAADALHEAGLVDVKQGTPKEYTPVSRETALRKLDLEREQTIEELDDLFAQLEPTEHQPEELGVWTVANRQAITSRALEFIENADDELVYMTIDDLLTDRILDALAAAADRDVDIYIAGISEPVQTRIRERVPSADLFETLWAWSETGAGRLLITDQRTALVSVVVDSAGGAKTDEVGIWGMGEHNSLVVVLRAIFTWRLSNNHPIEADSDTSPDG